MSHNSVIKILEKLWLIELRITCKLFSSRICKGYFPSLLLSLDFCILLISPLLGEDFETLITLLNSGTLTNFGFGYTCASFFLKKVIFCHSSHQTNGPELKHHSNAITVNWQNQILVISI